MSEMTEAHAETSDQFVRVGEHIVIAKGKPPSQIPYEGSGAVIYLSPEYLRNRASGVMAKPGLGAVVVAEGDAILLWDGSNAGEFFRGKPGIAASTMARLTPSGAFDSSFFFHALKHQEPILKSQTNGTGIPHVDREILEALQLYRPELGLQQAIARVLGTIDTTIRQTEAIIAKLKQVKQGLLHDLLTRGIDANGELRPPQFQAPHLYKQSPLGWIPNEWSARYFSDLASLITSGSRGWAAHYVDSGALFVRSQNVRMGNLDFRDRQHVSPPLGSEGQRTKLEGDDLLITITGNSVGNVAHVPSDWQEIAYVSQHVGLVRLFDKSLSRLAAFYLVQGAPGNQQLVDAQYGQSKPGLNLQNLRDLLVPCPFSEEVTAIVERITAFDKRADVEESYLAQLRELKQGLMDDLLTGSVRVTPLLEATDTP